MTYSHTVYRSYKVIIWTLGLTLCAHGGYLLFNSISSKAWPTVPGTITRSTIQLSTNSNDSAIFVVEYRYEVNGKEYVSDVQQFGSKGQFMGISAARRESVKYIVGFTYDVSYNPDHPEISVLEPNAPGYGYLFISMGVLLIVAGLSAGYLKIGRKIHREVFPTRCL